MKLCEDATGVRRLTAYLVAAPGSEPDTENVRATLVRQLPRQYGARVFCVARCHADDAQRET